MLSYLYLGVSSWDANYASEHFEFPPSLFDVNDYVPDAPHTTHTTRRTRARLLSDLQVHRIQLERTSQRGRIRGMKQHRVTVGILTSYPFGFDFSSEHHHCTADCPDTTNTSPTFAFLDDWPTSLAHVTLISGGLTLVRESLTSLRRTETSCFHQLGRRPHDLIPSNSPNRFSSALGSSKVRDSSFHPRERCICQAGPSEEACADDNVCPRVFCSRRQAFRKEYSFERRESFSNGPKATGER